MLQSSRYQNSNITFQFHLNEIKLVQTTRLCGSLSIVIRRKSRTFSIDASQTKWGQMAVSWCWHGAAPGLIKDQHSISWVSRLAVPRTPHPSPPAPPSSRPVKGFSVLSVTVIESGPQLSRTAINIIHYLVMFYRSRSRSKYLNI